MEQILLAYGFIKETVACIMMLYKNTKIKVHLRDEGTDFFECRTFSESPLLLHNLNRLRALNVDRYNERK